MREVRWPLNIENAVPKMKLPGNFQYQAIFEFIFYSFGRRITVDGSRFSKNYTGCP